MKDLLIEILVEEIPSLFAAPASESFKKLFVELLSSNNISYGEITAYTTPRRLALLATNVLDKATDAIIEVKGPMHSVCYDNGEFTKIGIGFLKSHNIDASKIDKIDDIECFDLPYTKNIGDKKYIFIKKEKKGETTTELIKNNLEKMVASIHFPKKMRWADKDFLFVRPIRGITLLYGSEVIESSVAGIKSSNQITGHRLLSKEFETIDTPSNYQSMLLKKSVMVSREERLLNIKKQIEDIEKKHGLTAVSKDKVSGIVVDLVEYPYLLTAEFDEKFLEVPDEVLISEMIEHQKYYPLRDKNGELTNMFVITANQPETPQIIAGNIRVIAARLSDGRFLYQEDINNGLDEMNKRLSMILFRANLGSVDDKVTRLKNASIIISDALGLSDKLHDIEKTLTYMKSDLVSNMVYQFPELQGIMGSYFAGHINLKSEIVVSIKEHYKPMFSGDSLPQNDIGKTVSILDKLDNIVAGFYVGDIPTGSEDPNALRRQALGIINILIELKKNIDLKSMIDLMISLMPKEALKNKSEDLSKDIITFFKSRFENDLSSKFSHDAIYGVLATGLTDVYDSYLKIVAIDSFRNANEDLFKNILTIFKRINNIIKNTSDSNINESLFVSDAEKNLYKVYTESLRVVDGIINERNYELAFEALSKIYTPLDSLFESVMIMDKDEAIKNNRVALLSGIDKLFKKMLDFSILTSK